MNKRWFNVIVVKEILLGWGVMRVIVWMSFVGVMDARMKRLMWLWIIRRRMLE
jgi:hypothetical protein